MLFCEVSTAKHIPVARVAINEYSLQYCLVKHGCIIDTKMAAPIDAFIEWEEWSYVYFTGNGRIFALSNTDYHIAVEYILKEANIGYYVAMR